MVGAFDNRLVTVKITIEGQDFTFDQRFGIVASGCRYTNGNFGECALRIDNIAKKTRDEIISKTTLWRNGADGVKHAPANVSLSVGRESYGTFQLYNGNMIACSPTQPPDIGLTMHSLSGAIQLTYPQAFSTTEYATVKDIAKSVADMAGVTLAFDAKNNPQIGNYHFTGPLSVQIRKLNDLGVQAYIDDASNTLVITDVLASRNLPVIEVNNSTDMIGVPEITEVGCRVRQRIRNEVQIGAPVNLTSVVNPTVNGAYTIFRLSFEVATRQNPFDWIMDILPKGNDVLAKQ